MCEIPRIMGFKVGIFRITPIAFIAYCLILFCIGVFIYASAVSSKHTQ